MHVLLGLVGYENSALDNGKYVAPRRDMGDRVRLALLQSRTNPSPIVRWDRRSKAKVARWQGHQGVGAQVHRQRCDTQHHIRVGDGVASASARLGATS